MASTQEKYNKIITLMLEKLNVPLTACLEVLERIMVLLDQDLPPPPPRDGPEKAQLLFITINKAESVSSAVSAVEWEIARREKTAVKIGGLINPQKTKTIRSRVELESLLDRITFEPVKDDVPILDQTPTGFNATTNTIDYAIKNQLPTKAVRAKPVEHRLDAPIHGRAIDQAMAECSEAERRDLYSNWAIERLKETSSGYSANPVRANTQAPDLADWTAAPPKPAPASATAKTISSGSTIVAPSAPAASAIDFDAPPVQIQMPKWTKGPPSTPEEVEEYKQFMIAKYEAEQLQNAEILRQMKLKAGKK